MKMKIEHYSFGNITVGGKSYTSDVIIYPDRVDSSWWRKEGHNLHVEDLKDIVKAQPDILVLGTGAYGVMRVPREIVAHLESKGIKAYAVRTGEAVDVFNDLQSKTGESGKAGVVIAALHLTC
jgi:hypothetical protein